MYIDKYICMYIYIYIYIYIYSEASLGLADYCQVDIVGVL